MSRKAGAFTLIEIIIVIVIIGVLATLALPKITGQIEASRAAEAMNMLGAIKRAAEQRCVDMGGSAVSFKDCTKFDQLGITPPTGSLFEYYALNTTSPGLRVKAVRTGLSALPAICMGYNPNDASPVRFGFNSVAGGNPYAGVVARTAQSTGTVVLSPTFCGSSGFATILMSAS